MHALCLRAAEQDEEHGGKAMVQGEQRLEQKSGFGMGTKEKSLGDGEL